MRKGITMLALLCSLTVGGMSAVQAADCCCCSGEQCVTCSCPCCKKQK